MTRAGWVAPDPGNLLREQQEGAGGVVPGTDGRQIPSPLRAHRGDPPAGPRWRLGTRITVGAGLCIDADMRAGAAEVRVTGDIDLLSARLLSDTLQMLAGTGRRRVRLDLAAVSFCDCAGLRVLLAGHAVLRAAGGALTLTGASPLVRRLLHLTGADHALTLAR